MEKVQKAVQDKMAALGATLSGATSLLAIVNGIPKTLEETLQKWNGAAPAVQWGTAAFFGLACVYLAGLSFRRRSRLKDRSAFSIDPANPRLLVGREDEVRTVIKEVKSNQLLFIEGDSGSGKSALLLSGVMPALKKSGIMPVYVDLSGVGWDDGLRHVVTQALSEAMTAEQKKEIEISRNSLDLAFKQFNEKLQTGLCLIFDQFDDYQVEHAGRFLRNNVWLDAADIEQDNPFWAGVAGALRRREIYCIFACRADAVAGLGSVRFVKDKTFHLRRISQELIEPIFDKLSTGEAGQDVIDQPAAGWEHLRQRLVKDIAVNSRILPIQLAVTLEALRRLQYLTVPEYEKKGGVAGLERLHIERNAADAADAAGMTTKQLLGVLRALSNDQGTKTIPRLQTDILADVNSESGSQVKSEQLGRALEVLTQLRIVRKRQTDADGGVVWLLRHDFLARGVVAAQRHADRWRIMLEEAQEAFDAASGLAAKWNTMLALDAQVHLLWEKLHGRVDYGPQWRIASLSAMRLARPFLFCCTLIGIWIVWDRAGEENMARELFNAIGQQSDRVSAHEIEQLNALAAATPRVQELFIRLAFDRLGDFERSARRMDLMLNMWLRLDPSGSRREKLHNDIIMPLIDKNGDDLRIYKLAVYAWKQAPLSPAQAKLISEKVVHVLSKATDRSRFVDGINILANIPYILPQEKLDRLLVMAAKLNDGNDETRIYSPGTLSVSLIELLMKHPPELVEQSVKQSARSLQEGTQPLAESMYNYLFFKLFRSQDGGPMSSQPQWDRVIDMLCEQVAAEKIKGTPRSYYGRIGNPMKNPANQAAPDEGDKCSQNRIKNLPQFGLKISDFFPESGEIHDENVIAAAEFLVNNPGEISDKIATAILPKLKGFISDHEGYRIKIALEAWLLFLGTNPDQAARRLEDLIALIRKKDYLHLPDRATALAQKVDSKDRRRLLDLLMEDLGKFSASRDRIWTQAQLIDMLADPDDSSARFHFAKQLLSSTENIINIENSISGKDAWQQLASRISRTDARSLVDLTMEMKLNSMRLSYTDWAALLLPFAGKISEEQLSKITEKLYERAFARQVARNSLFEDSPAINMIIFCNWALAIGNGRPEILPKLLDVLALAGSQVPKFVFINERSFSQDEFGIHQELAYLETNTAERNISRILASAPEARIVDILKLPYATGPLRRAALGALEQRVGQSFGGDVWKFVEWARSPAAKQWKFDLEGPADNTPQTK